MKLHASARKHFDRDGLTVAGVLRAALVILSFDSGEELVIHAMKARPQYVSLLS